MTGSDRSYSRLANLKTVGRHGLQALSLIVSAVATNVTAAANVCMRSSRCFGLAWSVIALCGWGGLPAAGHAQQQAGAQTATTELKPTPPKKGRDNNYTAKAIPSDH